MLGSHTGLSEVTSSQSQAETKYFRSNYFYLIQYFSQLTDAVREVVIARGALVTECAAVVVATRALEVTSQLVLGHTDREPGVLVLERSLGEAGAGLAVRVVVVTLSTGAAVLRPSERLLTLAQPVTGSTVARVTGVRTVTS